MSVTIHPRPTDSTSVDVGSAPRLPPARRLEGADLVQAARRLHAQEYRRVGYVPGDDALSNDGTLRPEVDPWVPYSTYFGAFDEGGAVRATCRVIRGDAPWPLPATTLPGVDAAFRHTVQTIPGARLGEISALARDLSAGQQYTRALFRAVWADALECGLTSWVLCVDRLVLRILRQMDEALFRVVGTWSPAPVRPVVPVWVRVADVREEIFGRGLSPEVGVHRESVVVRPEVVVLPPDVVVLP